jgi:hypothetical protein
VLSRRTLRDADQSTYQPYLTDSDLLSPSCEINDDFGMTQCNELLISCRGVLPSIASTIWYNLPYGSSVAMTWGWLLAGSLILFVGLAMGDLASSMPTS